MRYTVVQEANVLLWLYPKPLERANGLASWMLPLSSELAGAVKHLRPSAFAPCPKDIKAEIARP